MSNHGNSPEGGLFEESRISRRQFVRLSAATGTALSLPGNATSSAESAAFDREYQFILNHTPSDYHVPTLIEFNSIGGLEAFDRLDVGQNDHTTTEPTTAAYAELTTKQAQQVAELPTAENLSHSPGSNPFWRLGYYPLGVFPAPERSTGFIDYEEMVAGLKHLEAQHSDRLDFYSIGKSPGHVNYLSNRRDPKDVYVAEITNNIGDEEAFREKQKVMFSLSIHGLERAGVEAGTRFIESLLEGEEDEIEQLLDDTVIIFVYPNPDGWVAKHPQYDSAWQTGGRDDVGIPGGPFYERGNARTPDLNREFPTAGWINPELTLYPAEPTGRNLKDDDPGLDRDIPADVLAHTPDVLSVVDHFRDYENLTHGADLHGALQSEYFVFGLLSKAQYNHGQFHDAYEMHRVIDESLEEELQAWTTLGDARKAVTGDVNPSVAFRSLGTLPSEAYEYATIWDLIGFIRSGVFGDWMAYPEDQGGLGLTSVDFEMAYTHMVGANVYNPALVEMQVRGYKTAIRTVTDYATRDVEGTIETGGASTAYVTTDALTRTSDDLSFQSSTENETDTNSTTESLKLSPDGHRTVTHEIPATAHSLAITASVQSTSTLDASVIDPAGEVVSDVELNSDDERTGTPSWVFTDPELGVWSLLVENPSSDLEIPIQIRMGTVETAAEHPDPEEALGYQQRSYEVTPLTYFEEYSEYTDASVDPLSVQDVRNRQLLRGQDPAYDNLVIIHDEGRDDQRYLDAIDEFVAAGGNLVLTDSGVSLLADLENGLAEGFSAEDISEELFVSANLEEKDLEHPLLEGARPIQRELWKGTPLGYAGSEIPGTDVDRTAEAPMTLVDPDRFEAESGSIGGMSHEQVAVGTLSDSSLSEGSIHVLGGLLPPANQSHLHPFGMRHYAVSFLGHTILTNSLGYTQRRFVDGKLVAEFGSGD